MEKTVEQISEGLDFSSWFDMWHTHLDWESKGQENWKNRQQCLKKLFSLYEYLNQKMVQHNRVYQSFCIIDLEDSGQDAVYIHTENPNKENYPIKFEESNKVLKLDYPLLKFIEEEGYRRQVLGDSTIVVFRYGLGEHLF